MTSYAFDSARRVLVGTWSTGWGNVAVTVADLPTAIADETALHLARELSGLAGVLWRCYTHPASASPSLDVNTEGWRRQGERDAFSRVAAAIQGPNLPSAGGLLVSYSPVVERSHRVGRALHEIGAPDLTEQVVCEVKAELNAVEQAELGDLSGRAQQAVALSRADVSPAQVAAADHLLDGDLFGGIELFTNVDPTAAAVAAAHWLAAAADIAAEVSGLESARVVVEADNIEALPHETPTRVLEGMDSGFTPYQVVTKLVRDAMDVAGGQIPDPETIADLVARAGRDAKRFGQDDPERLRLALLSEIRATPLDPSRPAVDLLEDLLSGMHGCWLIYQEYANEPDDDDDETAEPLEDGEDADEDDNETIQRAIESAMQEFAAAVREEASAQRSRIL
jgi:hypothetical protein